MFVYFLGFKTNYNTFNCDFKYFFSFKEVKGGRCKITVPSWHYNNLLGLPLLALSSPVGSLLLPFPHSKTALFLPTTNLLLLASMIFLDAMGSAIRLCAYCFTLQISQEPKAVCEHSLTQLHSTVCLSVGSDITRVPAPGKVVCQQSLLKF